MFYFVMKWAAKLPPTHTPIGWIDPYTILYRSRVRWVRGWTWKSL